MTTTDQHVTRSASVSFAAALLVVMAGGCGAGGPDDVLDETSEPLSGPTEPRDLDADPTDPPPPVDDLDEADPGPGIADDGVLAWVQAVDGLCATAVAQYDELDRQDPDPVSATVAAANLVGQVADAAARTVPADPGALALAQALTAYADGEAQVAVAMDQGSMDEMALSDQLQAAGTDLVAAATAVGASSCAAISDEM